jgi:hypothetical protein
MKVLNPEDDYEMQNFEVGEGNYLGVKESARVKEPTFQLVGNTAHIIKDQKILEKGDGAYISFCTKNNKFFTFINRIDPETKKTYYTMTLLIPKGWKSPESWREQLKDSPVAK